MSTRMVLKVGTDKYRQLLNKSQERNIRGGSLKAFTALVSVNTDSNN
jgi:hypothetical protein